MRKNRFLSSDYRPEKINHVAKNTLYVVVLAIWLFGGSLAASGMHLDGVSQNKERSDQVVSEVREQIEKLKSSDPTVRAYAIVALGEMGPKATPAIPELTQLTKDRTPLLYKMTKFGEIPSPNPPNPKDWSGTTIRLEAFEALGNIGPAAIEPLMESMGADDFNIGAGPALLRIGKPAVPFLLEALKTYGPTSRGNAASLLGMISDARAIGPLIAALGDGEEEVRRAVVHALGGFRDPRVVEALITILKSDPDDLVREYAAMMLGDGRDPRAVEPLIQALSDKLNVARVAVRSLATYDDRRSAETLTAILNGRQRDLISATAISAVRLKDPRVEEALRRLLNDTNDEIRRTAAESLERRGWQPADKSQEIDFLIAKCDWIGCENMGRAAVEALIPRLRDENPDIRKNTAIILGKIKDGRTIGPLLEALTRDENSPFREDLLSAIGKLNDSDTIPIFIGFLKDPDSSIREAAATGLGNMKAQQAVDPLMAALRDQAGNVRAYAAFALGRIGDPRAITPLIRLLDDEYVSVRCMAAVALGEIGSEKALNSLIVGMKDLDYNVQCEVARALGSIGSPKAIPTLIQALADSNLYTSSAAAEALGTIGGPAIERLLPIMRSLNPRLRELATKALGMTRDLRATDALLKALKDSSAEVRRGAAEALGEMRIGRAVEGLIEGLSDEDAEMRRYCADALGKVRDGRAVEPLIARLDDRSEEREVKSAAASVLEQMPDPRAVGPLIRSFPWLDTTAVRALVKIGTSALPALITALKDDKGVVRSYSARTLGILKDTAAVQPLIEILNDPEWYVRKEAIEALGSIGDKRASGALLPYLYDQDRESRLETIKTMGKLKVEQAIRPLIDILAKNDLYYRKEAASSLREITGQDFGIDSQAWMTWWLGQKK